MLQDYGEALEGLIRALVDEVHTAMPGRIDSFDPASGQAKVTPLCSREVNGKAVPYPQIGGVPVVMPGPGVAIPVRAGDWCLLVVSETSLEQWRHGTEGGAALTHDLTNAMAIPGLAKAGGADIAEAAATGAILLRAGDTVLKVKPEEVTVIGNLTVTGTLTTAGKNVTTHTHTAPAGGGTTSGMN
jgi:hypothetical protein